MTLHFGFDPLAPLKDAASAVGDLVAKVPGASWVGDALETGAGWIGEMARTPWGYAILTAATGTFVLPALAPVVGPQVASVAWALPGLAAGECFQTAYLKEVVWRLEAVATYFGGKAAGDAVAGELKRLASDPRFVDLVRSEAVQKLRREVGTREALRRLNLTPEQIAPQFGARADTVALTTNLILCELVYRQDEFTVATGRPKRPRLGKRGDGRTAQELSIALQQAIQQKRPEAEIADLRQRYLERQSYEQNRDDSEYLLERIDAARARNAPAATVAALEIQYMNALRREQERDVAVGEGSFRIAGPGLEVGAPSTLQKVALAALLTSPLWGPAAVRAVRRMRA